MKISLFGYGIEFRWMPEPLMFLRRMHEIRARADADMLRLLEIAMKHQGKTVNVYRGRPYRRLWIGRLRITVGKV